MIVVGIMIVVARRIVVKTGIVVETEIVVEIGIGDVSVIEATEAEMIERAGEVIVVTGTETTVVTVGRADIVETVEGPEVGHGVGAVIEMVAEEKCGLVWNRKSDLSQRWEQRKS